MYVTLQIPYIYNNTYNPLAYYKLTNICHLLLSLLIDLCIPTRSSVGKVKYVIGIDNLFKHTLKCTRDN